MVAQVPTTPRQAGRGNRVHLNPKWLELIKERLGDDRESYEKLAALLTDAIKRPSPWGKSTVERYLNGTLCTDEMTLAFSELLGLPYPLLSAGHPEEVSWFEAGCILRELRPDVFYAHFGELTERADLAKREHELDQRRRSRDRGDG